MQYVTRLAQADADLIDEACATFFDRGVMPTEADFASLRDRALTTQTCHNRARDSIQSVHQAPMDALVAYLCAALGC